jgi:hypothetical protein
MLAALDVVAASTTTFAIAFAQAKPTPMGTITVTAFSEAVEISK